MSKKDKFVPSLNDRGYRFRTHSRTTKASCVFDVRKSSLGFEDGDISARSTCVVDSKGTEIFEFDVLEYRGGDAKEVKRKATGKPGPLLLAVVWRSGEPAIIDQDGCMREGALDSDKWMRHFRVGGNLVTDEDMRTEFCGYLEMPQ